MAKAQYSVDFNGLDIYSSGWYAGDLLWDLDFQPYYGFVNYNCTDDSSCGATDSNSNSVEIVADCVADEGEVPFTDDFTQVCSWFAQSCEADDCQPSLYDCGFIEGAEDQ